MSVVPRPGARLLGPLLAGAVLALAVPSAASATVAQSAQACNAAGRIQQAVGADYGGVWVSKPPQDTFNVALLPTADEQAIRRILRECGIEGSTLFRRTSTSRAALDAARLRFERALDGKPRRLGVVMTTVAVADDDTHLEVQVTEHLTTTAKENDQVVALVRETAAATKVPIVVRKTKLAYPQGGLPFGPPPSAQDDVAPVRVRIATTSLGGVAALRTNALKVGIRAPKGRVRITAKALSGRKVTVARRTLRVQSGGSTVRLRLTAAGRTRLKAKRRFTVRVRVAASGQKAVSRNVRLRF